MVARMSLEDRHQRPVCGDCCLVSYMFGVSWRPSTVARLYPRDILCPQEHLVCTAVTTSFKRKPGFIIQCHHYLQIFKSSCRYINPSLRDGPRSSIQRPRRSNPERAGQGFWSDLRLPAPRLWGPLPCPIFIRGFSGAGPGGRRRH